MRFEVISCNKGCSRLRADSLNRVRVSVFPKRGVGRGEDEEEGRGGWRSRSGLLVAMVKWLRFLLLIGEE